MKVIASDRRDLDAYFRLSGIREYKRLTDTPFLAFVISGDTVKVKIVENAMALLEYPDATQVMSQWRGQWKSDYFQFNVGNLRRYIASHPAEKHDVV